MTMTSLNLVLRPARRGCHRQAWSVFKAARPRAYLPSAARTFSTATCTGPLSPQTHIVRIMRNHVLDSQSAPKSGRQTWK